MDNSRDITIAIFSKPPVAGAVKTRLEGEVGREGAARLAAAFLIDTVRSVRELSWARPVLSTAGDFPSNHPVNRHLTDLPRWDQGLGDLGARIERILKRGLAEGARAVIALGADIPGLPPAYLEEARSALEAREAVIGPCDDGGYYLLGVRHCPDGMLDELPWSSPETFEATKKRLVELGMNVALVPPHPDVDVPADLDKLAKRLEKGELIAPATREALQALGRL